MTHPNIDEVELVEGCLKQDRRFQELLYKRFSAKMYGVCLSYCKDADDAKDVLQEGFIKIFTHISHYSKKAPLEVWIRRIMVNTAIDSYRKQIRLVSVNFRIEESDIEPIEAHVLSKIDTRDLMQMVEKLPHGCKMVFNLFALEGYSHKEIAESLNISEGTSKSQFARARKLLQEKLAFLHEEETATHQDANVTGILQMV